MIDWYSSNIVLIQSTLTTLLMALSIQVPMRAGVFSFAGVGAFGIGGYGAAMLMIHAELGTVPSVLIATLIGGVVVFLLGLVIAKLTGLYLAMATVAFTLIVAVLAVNGGELTGGASGLFGALGDITTLGLFVVAVVVVALLTLTERGSIGRQLDTVREDPELANSLGIQVNFYRRMSFLVSGLLGGLSGALTTLLRSTITPAEVNFHLIVLALTIIVVGGSGSWIGALLGTVIFVWLPTWLTVVSEWEELIYGVLVTVAAIFLPKGVLGVIQNTWHRYRSRRLKAEAGLTGVGAEESTTELALDLGKGKS